MANARCPKCGTRTTIRTAKKDDCEYHVCINYPRCKGRVLAEEDQGGDWGKERPASRTTHDSTRRRINTEAPKSKAEWGDDWGKESPAAKAAPAKPRRPKPPEPKPPVAPKPAHEEPKQRQEQEPADAKPRQRIKADVLKHGAEWGDDWGEEKSAPKREVSPEKKKPPKLQQQRAPKPASYLPQYKRAPKSYVAPGKKEPSKSRQQIAPKREPVPDKKESSETQPRRASKPVSFLPLYKRTPKKYVAPEKKEPPKPRPQIVPEPADVKPRLPEAAHIEPFQQVAPETKRDETQQQIVPKADTAPEVKAPPKLRQQRVPQRYLASDKKKRSTVVVIIALVIAFLAIDGMIYAAFVLR